MNKNHLLDQRTVIVTGGATGIGQAFAVQSAAQGANVVDEYKQAAAARGTRGRGLP